MADLSPHPDPWASYKDPTRARAATEEVHELAARYGEKLTFMEVCGTHTMQIERHGIRRLMPKNVRLVSGPGCPVCVSGRGLIDAAIHLADRTGVRLATFGDLVRVPGHRGSLERARAAGASVQVVYSPLDALALAEAHPADEICFVAIGFETTAPAVAATAESALERGVPNFFILPACKTMPPPMRALLAHPDLALDGFICPGHVSVITGLDLYRPLVRDFAAACVIAGFEALDVLESVAALIRQKLDDRAAVEIQYKRAVRAEGNPAAREIVARVFEPADAWWRGLGVIPASGLAFREAYRSLDALEHFDVRIPPEHVGDACRCGDVLTGVIEPEECKLFAGICTPDDPFGPCMVSSEGACAARLRYHNLSVAS
ncbi:MAG: hydrogenase formation protein HypD [Gemmatimonadetes bacterium]|nr:hydrogenase formation protein HypD [Gemmatimonadota bacterium]